MQFTHESEANSSCSSSESSGSESSFDQEEDMNEDELQRALEGLNLDVDNKDGCSEEGLS